MTIDTFAADDADAVARTVRALDAGELAVVPGDARYLLVADALDDEAVARLFLATGRGADRPLTVAVAAYADLHHVAFGGPLARDLAARHWPGPWALVLRARPWLPDAVTAGGDSVAVTVPQQPFTNALARQFGPLACAGARRMGEPDALDATAARDAVGAAARVVVDGGRLPGGRLAVVDATQAEAKVIRDGTVATD